MEVIRKSSVIGDTMSDLKRYNCQLERFILAKCPELTLLDLRKNIDILEKSVAVSTSDVHQLAEPSKNCLDGSDDNVIAKLPKKMASISDQSFISFMRNSKRPHPSEYKHVVDQVSPEILREAIGLLPPLSRMRKIVDVFIDICETNYFYLHPRDIYRQIEEVYQNVNDSLYMSHHWVNLVQIMGILSIATSYEYLKDNGNMPCSEEGILWEDIGYPYFLLMLPFVGFLIHNNNLQSIQIFQVMGVYMTTKRVDTITLCIDHGYRYLCLAMEIALTNKLHLEETYKDMSESDSEVRRRIWWSCFCLERRLGFNLEKPELIDLKEVTVSVPQPNSSLLHLDGTSNWINQLSLIEVIKLFRNISDLVYRSNKGSSITVSSKTVKEISLQLDIWKDVVHERRTGPQSFERLNQCLNYRANKHLDLFYYLGKIYLGKSFLLFQVENHETLIKQPKSNQSLFINYMTSVCIDAAYNIFDILSDMKKNNQLGIYSSTDLNFCNIGLFVTVAFLKIDSSRSTEMFLRKGLDVLKELSKGSSSAKVNVSMFEMFDKDINHLPSSPCLPTSLETPGMFPDWDVDIYTSDLPFNSMGSLPIPKNDNNGYDGGATSHTFHDEFLTNLYFN